MTCVGVSLLTGVALYLRMLQRAMMFSSIVFVSSCGGWLQEDARMIPSPAIRVLAAFIVRISLYDSILHHIFYLCPDMRCICLCDHCNSSGN